MNTLAHLTRLNAAGRLWLVTLATALTATACNCGAESPTSNPTQAQPTEPAPPTLVPPAEQRSPNQPSQLSAETVSRVLAHIRNGRRASRARDYALAVTEFDQALTLSPQNPRVLCENGYVRFLQGDLRGAAARIDLALSLYSGLFTRERVSSNRATTIQQLASARIEDSHRAPIAMCLYNRGLVARQQQDFALARASLTASIALRPNASVSAQLAQLPAVGQTTAARPLVLNGIRTIEDSDGVIITTQDFEVAAQTLLQLVRFDECESEGRGESFDILAQDAAAPTGTCGPACVVQVRNDSQCMLATQPIYLMVLGPQGYRVQYLLEQFEDLQDNGSNDEHEVEAEIRIGAGELVVTTREELLSQTQSTDTCPSDNTGEDECYEITNHTGSIETQIHCTSAGQRCRIFVTDETSGPQSITLITPSGDTTREDPDGAFEYHAVLTQTGTQTEVQVSLTPSDHRTEPRWLTNGTVTRETLGMPLDSTDLEDFSEPNAAGGDEDIEDEE